DRRLRRHRHADARAEPSDRGGPRQSARRRGCRARRLTEPRPVLLYDQARRLDQARRPAMRPVRNTPSNVPAPPIDTAGAPIRGTGAVWGAPARPRGPVGRAASGGGGARRNARINATPAAMSGGAIIGTRMPRPGTISARL